MLCLLLLFGILFVSLHKAFCTLFWIVLSKSAFKDSVQHDSSSLSERIMRSIGTTRRNHSIKGLVTEGQLLFPKACSGRSFSKIPPDEIWSGAIKPLQRKRDSDGSVSCCHFQQARHMTPLGHSPLHVVTTRADCPLFVASFTHKVELKNNTNKLCSCLGWKIAYLGSGSERFASRKTRTLLSWMKVLCDAHPSIPLCILLSS